MRNVEDCYEDSNRVLLNKTKSYKENTMKKERPYEIMSFSYV